MCDAVRRRSGNTGPGTTGHSWCNKHTFTRCCWQHENPTLGHRAFKINMPRAILIVTQGAYNLLLVASNVNRVREAFFLSANANVRGDTCGLVVSYGDTMLNKGCV